MGKPHRRRLHLPPGLRVLRVRAAPITSLASEPEPSAFPHRFNDEPTTQFDCIECSASAESEDVTTVHATGAGCCWPGCEDEFGSSSEENVSSEEYASSESSDDCERCAAPFARCISLPLIT